MAELHAGMGVAVAERTILRPKYKENPPAKLILNPADPDQQKWFQVAYGSDVPVEYNDSAEFIGRAPERDKDFVFETWEDVAERVAEGSVSLLPEYDINEKNALKDAISSGTALMSGRHMQHGDRHQSSRPMMVFTNCSTSANSFGQFYLLLNGSGVGRSYDDDMMLVDWDFAPNVQCVISENHKDYPWGGQFLSTREAQHRFNGSTKVHWFTVPDSREGWAQAIEYIEGMTYQKIYRDHLLVLDFSSVRPSGSPIKGMQGRPSSGPIPLMAAIHKMMTIKGAGMPKWKQAMFVDHYAAECVLVGGARRCLPEGTMVKMVDGYTPIEEVSVGDIVSTVKGEYPITGVFDQGEQQTVVINHAFGKFECTPNHKMAVFTSTHEWEFKEARELEEGDRLVFDRGVVNFNDVQKMPSYELTERQKSRHNTTGINIIIPELNENLAWLIGLVHGNGYVHITKDGIGKYIEIAGNIDSKETIGKKAAFAFESFGVNPVVKDNPQDGTWRLRVASTQIATYFHQHIKKANCSINIPQFIFKSPANVRWAYLAGVFDSDGSNDRPVVLCSTVYKEYSEQLTLLCLSLGIIPHTNILERKEENWKSLYRIQLKAIENLNTLDTYFKKYSEKYVLKDRSHSAHGFSFSTDMVKKNHKTASFDGGNKNITSDRLSLNLGLSFDALPVPVYSVEPSGRTIQTYDIEIESIHQFTAEGFVVHNSARIAVKYWKDKGIFEFIEVKRPIEYTGLDLEQVSNYRKECAEQGMLQPQSFLWSANNSVGVDEEFWNLINLKRGEAGYATDIARHARKVFDTVIACSYGDGTGEPGFINFNHLVKKDDNFESTFKTVDPYMGFDDYRVHEDTEMYLRALVKRVLKKPEKYIVNPCSEIVLNLLGAFCVIGDIAPVMSDSYAELEERTRAVTRALIRTNTMRSIYEKEVKRTNRIGVSLTGVHEWAWKWFNLSFRDMLDEYGVAAEFWSTVASLSNAVVDEATKYSKQLGLPVPHTALTIKPAGTTAKWFGLTEGWHLPSMTQYLRWVSFRSDSEQVAEYRKKGYPTKDLKSYEGQTIVGFPTSPTLTELMPEEKIVTAGEATPEEQYEWLLLGEKYWLKGGDKHDFDNQISYTLKYKPVETSVSEFADTMKTYQSKVKCCSVMPQEEIVAYEYQPEQPITKAQYEELTHAIEKAQYEDVSFEHIDCSSGACPIDFNEDKL